MYKELHGRFGTISKEDVERASKYLHFTGDDKTDYTSIVELELLRENVVTGVANDKSKYNMPESFRTQLTWSINLRSLQNFLTLRTSKKALPEIQHLAHLIYAALPANIQSLVAHCVDPVDELTIAKARIVELEKQLKQFN